MNILRIGLIKECKIPSDKRVAFTPLQAKEIEQKYPYVKIVVQESPNRSFNDEEYKNEGIEVSSNVNNCDILMGIKEVPIANLIPHKTYLFFSHTIKKQNYNKTLLQEILAKNITLIDYEALKDDDANRLVSFSYFAGIVGAYNGLLTYGKRYHLYNLQNASSFLDIHSLKMELQKIKLPPIKIILTGNGNVAKGALEILNKAGIQKVIPEDFIKNTYTQPVFAQMKNKDYHITKTGTQFNKNEFYENPQHYVSTFNRYIKVADLLIAGAYWNPKFPVLFTSEDMKQPNFKIKVIADITCDIEGSIPSTKKSSTIADPVYDYDPRLNQIQKPFSNPHHITIMAVDNLPCELPRSASKNFGRDLIDKILPLLITKNKGDIIKRATLTMNGRLTTYFSYLENYVNQE